MSIIDDEDGNAAELDRLLAVEPGPLPPIAPDGGFAPGIVAEAEPIPEATLENFTCLRGPCIHYFEAQTGFQAGNTRGSLDHKPIQITRFCKALGAAGHIDLTDENVYDCNHWTPLLKIDVEQVQGKRKQWMSENPTFKVNKE